MKKEEVKIIYCYDDNNNAIHYSKTSKGNKYYCVDCGSELICKDGEVYQKHLAHKNTDNCGGTGESIFHKHWKENLFKPGMFINVANRINVPDNVEIYEVLNEVSLNKRYNKQWDKEIIVDTLLETERGDIVVEINYKNAKDWDILKPYYEALNLLRVYEVTVDKYINTKLEWFCLGEDEEILVQKEKERQDRIRKEREKEKLKEEKKRLREEKKKEKQRLKEEEMEKYKSYVDRMLDSGEFIKVNLFYNFRNKLIKVDNNTYRLTCLTSKDSIKFKKISLEFKLDKLETTASNLIRSFKVEQGIMIMEVTIDKRNPIEGRYYNAIEGQFPFQYNKIDKRLYAQLCNLAEQQA